MGLINEFKDFLKEYKVMVIAVAFIMGAAVKEMVQSFVNDLVMPVITYFIPGGGWQEATLVIGPIVIKWGSFLAALIDFIIIAIIVFLMIKVVVKEDQVKKK